ncbi:hypothetical protein NA57DRAFT_79099 [Rhizodiscina lignyota]|uniref:Uncharacterized protein n=1 Tax=Rhizodiscina lignyota TaxID=1504668 RepID=A0A9P4I9V3_9PEZI|nr:hypothetical protein NA57DRAFT_79099 [Rhizodiscina lignyota]
MIRPMLAADGFAARRSLQQRQVVSTSSAFPFSITVDPVSTPTPTGSSGQGSVFQSPSQSSTSEALFTFSGSAAPAASDTNGAPFGNSRGGIDDMTDKSGLSTGGIVAIVVVLVMLAFSAVAFVFLYRRGYFLKLQRRAQDIKLRTRRGPVNRSQISYPVDDKITLTRFASEPGTAPPASDANKSMTSFVVQQRISVDSLTNGPQWNSTAGGNGTKQELDNNRLSAPLPPTPRPIARPRESGTLGTMDWRTMNPVTPTKPVPPPKNNPFADSEADAANGRENKVRALDDLEEVLAMEREGK